jgi:acetylornithine/succinyldiaminopimelate/putrescine aminotransferase
MNATGLDLWRTDPFPMLDVLHVPFNDPPALAACLREHGHEVAAVIGEPIQGNGGINVPDVTFWPEVRRLCDQHGCLLILDEIQTGMNRTGRWFACEHWGVVPDLMTISKALGNGFPIAAFIATDAVAASYRRPGASTYGGNPVSATAALAVLDYHEQQDLGLQAAMKGRRLLEALCRHGEPRGLGLMCGLPLPSAERCDSVLEDLKDAGVLAGKTGHERNVLSFLPPLTITDEQLQELTDVLDEVLR